MQRHCFAALTFRVFTCLLDAVAVEFAQEFLQHVLQDGIMRFQNMN